MQFLLIAYDGTDERAGERRAAVRPAHLDRAKDDFANGTIKEGGAILSEDGRMIGSACILDFPDRAALDRWLETDPYVKGGVWQRIEILPFRCAPR